MLPAWPNHVRAHTDTHIHQCLLFRTCVMYAQIPRSGAYYSYAHIRERADAVNAALSAWALTAGTMTRFVDTATILPYPHTRGEGEEEGVGEEAAAWCLAFRVHLPDVLKC